MKKAKCVEVYGYDYEYNNLNNTINVLYYEYI